MRGDIKYPCDSEIFKKFRCGETLKFHGGRDIKNVQVGEILKKSRCGETKKMSKCGETFKTPGAGRP